MLGELYNVLTKKKLIDQEAAKQIILENSLNFQVVEIDLIKVVTALDINSRYGYSYWDSLVIATALNYDCSILYSEDMQHNQFSENNTRIVNPLLHNTATYTAQTRLPKMQVEYIIFEGEIPYIFD